MSIANIRAAVKAALVALPEVGIVNDLDPWNRQVDDFEGTHVDPATKRINGWSIGVREAQGTRHLGTMEHAYEIRLRGVLGREDDRRSRAEADRAIEAVIAALFASASAQYLPLDGAPTVDWTETPTTTIEDGPVRTSRGEATAHIVTITFTAFLETQFA